MCSRPVMFGGGMTIVKGRASLRERSTTFPSAS
jgi:hypothetical protein